MTPPTTPQYAIERTSRRDRVVLLVGAAVVAILAFLPAWGTSGQMKLLVEFFGLLAMAQMWNLLAGYAGLVSIGQQAFIGLGAYGLFVAADRLGVPLPIAVLLAAGVCGVVALATAFFAFRLQGGYFAIGTWVIAEVIRILVSNTRELGSGTGVTIQSLVSMDPPERQAQTYWLALALGVGSLVLAAWLMRSRLGLALRAVRDNEIAARSLGVDVFRAKLMVYVITAIGTGAAGAVAYLQLLRIQPNAAFNVEWTAMMIFIVVIGGLGRLEGPIVGTVAFFALQETLADFGSLYLVILGAVAIAITLVAPRGLWGLLTARRHIALFGVRRHIHFTEAPEPSIRRSAVGESPE